MWIQFIVAFVLEKNYIVDEHVFVDVDVVFAKLTTDICVTARCQQMNIPTKRICKKASVTLNNWTLT
jgi:hypothetical protein